MKLDKFKFAQVVNWLSHKGMYELDKFDLAQLDNLLDIEQPVFQATPADINTLMQLMAEGTRKIEAIKLHHQMTGYGLKESKDEIEKYWRPTDAFTGRIQDALGTAETGDALVEVARNAHRAEQLLVGQR